jgi:hypothetical protein
LSEESDLTTDYYAVTDDWRVRKYENEEVVLAALKGDDHVLFVYRTFCEKANVGRSPTGKGYRI